jgi:hypothetical protein
MRHRMPNFKILGRSFVCTHIQFFVVLIVVVVVDVVVVVGVVVEVVGAAAVNMTSPPGFFLI